jgi:hypothetical protein
MFKYRATFNSKPHQEKKVSGEDIATFKEMCLAEHRDASDDARQELQDMWCNHVVDRKRSNLLYRAEAGWNADIDASCGAAHTAGPSLM